MITPQQYTEIRARILSFGRWVDSKRNPKTGWCSYPAAEGKARPDYVSNDERGLVEEYEWLTDPPDRYFAYPASNDMTITNWTGIVLGAVTYRGDHWRSNFGDWRRSIRMRGTNGRDYAGIIYGTYARLRATK